MKMFSQMKMVLFLIVYIAFGVAAAPQPPANAFAIADEAGFFNLLDLTRPELALIRKAVEAGDWPAAKAAWANHLATRSTPRWLWSRRDRPSFQQIYDIQFGGLARYTNAADQVIARQFDFLGVQKQLAHDPQWLQGPIEWTHVLSRFGYWHDLGLAYWGTGRSAYARDFVELLEDWIKSNPVPATVSNERGLHGSVWRTLETGIRGQSWFETMEVFMDAPEFDAEAKYRMTRSLVEQARYLNAFSTAFHHGNWQVTEASGLASIGIMFPEFKEAAGWRERGLNLLVEHMQKDVLPDGAHWELTPGYHTWVMDEFMDLSLLCKANGLEVQGLLARHEKMFDFLEDISRPDRTYPPVGDAGIGRTTIEGSMGRGALLYQRPDFRYLAGTNCLVDWVWLFGPDVCSRFAALPTSPPAFTSVLLPDSKYAVMRSGWKSGDNYLLFDCAPWHGGHNHQDRLQVSVFAGRDLIVDPGQCSYDQPLSLELRKSAAHNVVMIDDQEQLRADPKLLAWHTDQQADFACGRVEADGFSHQRSVLFVKPGYWVVVDHILGQGSHQVARLFHFPIGPVQAEGNAAHTAFPAGMNIRVQPVDTARLKMRPGMIPTGPATAQKALVAALINQGKLPLTLCTVLLPYADVKDLPKVTSIPSGAGLVSRIRLEFPNGQSDEIAIGSAEGLLVIGSNQANTRALCVRRGPVANSVIVIPPGVGPETRTVAESAQGKNKNAP